MKERKRWLSMVLSLVMAVCCFFSPLMVQAEETETFTKKKVVVLDPGHGGREAGSYAVHNGHVYREEEINWKIAQYTMQELKKIDEVAYVRFASVYRQFADVESFFNELKKLMGDRKDAQ